MWTSMRVSWRSYRKVLDLEFTHSGIFNLKVTYGKYLDYFWTLSQLQMWIMFEATNDTIPYAKIIIVDHTSNPKLVIETS